MPVLTWRHPLQRGVDALALATSPPGRLGVQLGASGARLRPGTGLVYIAAGQQEVGLWDLEQGACHQVGHQGLVGMGWMPLPAWHTWPVMLCIKGKAAVPVVSHASSSHAWHSTYHGILHTLIAMAAVCTCLQVLRVLSPAEGPQAAAMPPASLQLSTRPSAPLPDLSATGTSLLPHSSKACSQGGSSGGRGARQGGQETGGSTGGDAAGVLEGQPLAELDTNQLLKQLEQQLAVGKIHEPQARCDAQPVWQERR